MTPASGSGAGAIFSYAMSDPNGVADLSWAEIVVNESLLAANSCFLHYRPGTNLLYLRNDASSAWLGPLAVGSPGVLQNAKCQVDVGASSVTTAGTTLTLHLDVQFLQGGTKNHWMRVSDLAAQTSAWAFLGNWTALIGPSQPPTADAVTPASGSGAGAIFSYAMSDPNGVADLSWAEINVNESLQGSNSCYLNYRPGTNLLLLRNDAGSAWLGPLAVGSPGVLQNAQCQVDVGASSVTTGGTTLTLHLDVQFLQGGAKNHWMRVKDLAAQTSAWALLGNWTALIGPSQPPTADSVTPSSGSGAGAIFSYAMSDPNGVADLSWAEINVNESLQGSNSCYLNYRPGTNLLLLRNDAGSAWLGPLAVGSPGVLQNAQCQVDVGASSVTTGGTTLTLHLDVQFLQGGTKNHWMRVSDLAAQTTGWVLLGNWTAVP